MLRLPMAGNRLSSRLLSTRRLCSSDHFLFVACHSTASCSKVALLPAQPYHFSFCLPDRCCLPKAYELHHGDPLHLRVKHQGKHQCQHLLLSAKAILQTQYFEPFGWTRRCIPLPSVSLYCLSVGLAVLTLISVRAMLIPSLLVQALSNRKYHHLYQHLLVDVR